MILLINILLFKKNFIINTNKVRFIFTNRGRKSEFKFLDKDYYSEMRNFKFIFCPKGDFIWTYRFFESIQVGSIPIILFRANVYVGFKYLSLYNPFSKLGESDVERNILKFKSIYNLKSN